MAEPLAVLITGAGSELAFSIFKACQKSTLDLRIIGCDIAEDAVGLHWADRGYLVPAVKHDPNGFLGALRQIVERESVRAIFPSPDAELDFLPEHRELFAREHNCHLMINAPKEMARFSDKWLAHQWYLEHGLGAPRTARGDVEAEREALIADLGFPLVLKPRIGGGSRSVFIVDSRQQMEKYLPAVPAPLLQERLLPDDEEYTAGTFRTQDDAVFVIVMRRTLKFGMTNKAQMVFDGALDAFCQHVILQTQLQGVNNIQFRLTTNGPKILEINPRFSGTTGIRAHFGFNEPEMVLRHFVLGQDLAQPTLRPGRVARFMEELYLDAEADPARFGGIEK
ncbi:MAG: ATP-grasp domain-containing protein [Deltaproteobacteria bacterium]|nr:ATP-grasp domain-containing protein [Deltaproteobacteria bacterium]